MTIRREDLDFGAMRAELKSLLIRERILDLETPAHGPFPDIHVPEDPEELRRAYWSFFLKKHFSEAKPDPCPTERPAGAKTAGALATAGSLLRLYRL